MFDATPLLKLYAKIRGATLQGQHPAKTQQAQLLKLIAKAQGTKFGQDYSFATIRSVEEYQSRVPLRKWEDFSSDYWKNSFPHIEGITWPSKSHFFPVTSGTTSGATKFMPYSKEMQNSNTKAGLDLLVHHVLNHPSSKVFGGKSFVLGGSTELVEEAPGIYSGDLSGIAAKTLPWWAEARFFPPQEVALISDWEEKVETFTRMSLNEDIRSISGVPSWMLIFFDKLAELKPEFGRKAANFFPNLELVVHGGISFAPYREQFLDILEGSSAELREVYPCSEGFLAIADREYGEGLRLILDNGIFFEFVPLEELENENPTRHWIGNVESDRNYAVVLTTCAGVWSYVLGDTIKFVDTETPRVLITGRTSYSLSTVGEHLIGEEIEEGLTAASQATGSTVTDYAVGSIFPEKEGDLAQHLYFVEFTESNLSSQHNEEFIAVLDSTLVATNEDYEAHRKKGFGLHAPKVCPVKPGFFAAWMKSRGKLGGQNKVPRVINDTELFENLKNFFQSYK